ncbi:MAG: hypothetical protein GF331_07170 [Chitinivibrionales bacterium]|nr:hypothetical protein [Chitinivibrionales bacterium]
MSLLDHSSLAGTLDAVDACLFDARPIPAKQRDEISEFLADSFGKPGGYQGLFAPGPKDVPNKSRFFTGEKITSSASLAHILAEDSIRILTLLDSTRKRPRDVLESAKTRLAELFDRAEKAGYNPGTFCCGKCTAAFWRNLYAIGWPDFDRRISLGMAALKRDRDGKGRWARYPFHYTSLVLLEMDPVLVSDELRYTVPRHESYLKRKSPVGDEYGDRCRAVSERVLSMVG